MDNPKPVGPIASFFAGEWPNQQFFSWNKISEDEQESLELLLTSLERFMQQHESDFITFDREGYQSDEFIGKLAELGLFSLIIPEEYDGLGLSSRSYAEVLAGITRYDGSTALTVGAHSSIGLKGLLMFGTPEQKSRYLPKLSTGEMIAAFCLTEPGAGSDVASLRSRATPQPDGGWLLEGEKIWITNGPIAQFFTVFARTSDEPGSRGISAFIVERDWPEVSVGPKEDKMGIRASATGTVSFSGVKLPPESLLGEEGQGFKIAMAILNNGRSGLGGGCIGSMRRCIALAKEHASQRKQFGQTLDSFELIQTKIARMEAACFATEAVVHQVATYIDEDTHDYALEAAASKVFATDQLWQVAYDALQIAGGNGFMREYPYEMITRDARINMIDEGTNEILRLFIGLKALESLGKDLKESMKTLKGWQGDPGKAAKEVLSFLTKRTAPFAALTPLGNMCPQLKGLSIAKELNPEVRVLKSQIATLHNRSVDALRKYRGDVKDKQVLVSELADLAIRSFAGFATLTRRDGEVGNIKNAGRFLFY